MATKYCTKQFLESTNVNFCEELIKSNSVDINSVNDRGWSKLHIACYHNNVEMVKMLLKYNINRDIKLPGKQLAVMLSTNLEIIKLLITYVNIADNDGDTLLHYLARKEEYDTIMALLKMNVKYNIKNKVGKTAKDVCDKPEIFDIFELESKFLNTNEIDYAEYLITEKKVNINCVDISGCTKLHKSIVFNDIEMVKMLVKYGIDQFVKDNMGAAAIHYAKSNNAFEILKDSINVVDSNENTLLHYNRLTKEDIKCLLNLGAKYDIENKQGKVARETTYSSHIDLFPVTVNDAMKFIKDFTADQRKELISKIVEGTF